MLAEVFEFDVVDFTMTVDPTPFALFELDEELFLTDATEF